MLVSAAGSSLPAAFIQSIQPFGLHFMHHTLPLKLYIPQDYLAAAPYLDP